VPIDALAPVPGDPNQVLGAAHAFASVAAHVADASAKLRALSGSGATWSGTAATMARARSATFSPKLEKVRASYASAGNAMNAYARALAQAQQQSASAVRTAEAAREDLQATRSAEQAAAARDAEQAAAAVAAGQPAPPATAPRYQGAIADAASRLARATAANAAAHEEQQRAARTAASGLRQASHDGLHNQAWWRHVVSSAAHWAATTWDKSLRTISRIATTVSALAGLAALVLSVAGIFFPPLEAAAAVLETISLVSAVVGAAADTTLAASGKGSWTAVGIDAVSLAPCVGSVAIRKAARFFRNPTVVHASTTAMSDADALASARSGKILKLSTDESWRRATTLPDHVERHGADFGLASDDEYAAHASRFLQDGLAQRFPTKVDSADGTIRIYDRTTNTFGSYNSDGSTRTFYKPDPARHHYADNWSYWLGQPGGEVWDGS
jgi:hypothetical protein